MKTPQLPHPKLSALLGIPNEIWLKREDEHHYLSHKGRSIPIMIEHYAKSGQSNFVISSSGNAALAGALYIQTHNRNHPEKQLTLKIFVGKKIPAKKLAAITSLTDEYISVEQISNPKQSAFTAEKSGAIWLRQSTDDTALTGYEELAGELARIPNLSAVFIPTSSGTTAVGLHLGFKKLGTNPQIHIVQTPACHPFVLSEEKGNSLADAITDKVAHRREGIKGTIKESDGDSWIASDEEIRAAQKIILDSAETKTSPNGILGVSGLIQAIKKGRKFSGPIVCIITGN